MFEACGLILDPSNPRTRLDTDMKILILCECDGAISTHDIACPLVNHVSSGDWKAIDPVFRSFEAFCTARGIDLKIVSVGSCKKETLQGCRKEYDNIVYIGNGLSDRWAAREADFVFAKDSLYTTCVDEDIPCHFYQDFRDILGDMRKVIRGVIFDLDGTLIDASEAIYLGLKEVWHAYGREIFPVEDLGKYLKADLETTLGFFFPAKEVPNAIPIMRKKYEEIYLEKTRFINGTEEVLRVLHSRGIVLGVASNKFGRFSRGAVMHLGANEYFAAVIGAGDVPRNKPFPDMLHAALDKMKLAARDVVFVGDTPSDIETGKNAGIDVYALPTGFHSKRDLSEVRPKRILRRLHDLIDLTAGPEQTETSTKVPFFLRPRIS